MGACASAREGKRLCSPGFFTSTSVEGKGHEMSAKTAHSKMKPPRPGVTGKGGEADTGGYTRKIRQLSDLDLMEALQLMSRLREGLDNAMMQRNVTAGGGDSNNNQANGSAAEADGSASDAGTGSTDGTHPHQFRMTANIANMKGAPLFNCTLGMRHHQNNAQAEMAKLKAPPHTTLAIYIDLPLRADRKKLNLEVGKLSGRIQTIMKYAAPRIKEKYQSFLANERALEKDDHDNPVFRLTFFFSEHPPGLSLLSLLRAGVVRIAIGESGGKPPRARRRDISMASDDDEDDSDDDQSHTTHEDSVSRTTATSIADGETPRNKAEAGSEDAKKAADSADGAKKAADKAPTEESENYPYFFPKLPSQLEKLAARAHTELQPDPLLVSYLAKFLQDTGFAPPDKDEGVETVGQPSALVSGVLSLHDAQYFDTVVRYATLPSMLTRMPQVVSLITQGLQRHSVSMHQRMLDTLPQLFVEMDDASRATLLKSYSALVEMAPGLFEAHNGKYRIGVVADTGAHIRLSIKGISPFTVLPTAEQIEKQVEVLKKEAEEMKDMKLDHEKIKRFNDSEYDKLIETLDDTKTSEEWKLTYSNETQNPELWVNDSKEFPMVKVRVTMRDVPSQLAFHLFTHPQKRALWDENVGECRVVQKFSDEADVFYTVFATPGHVSNRDFVEYRQVKRVNDGVLMLARSVIHPGAPVRPNRVRATTIYSGYYFRDVKVGNNKHCLVTGVIQQDYGGWLSSASYLLSVLHTQVLPEWIRQFSEACAEAAEKAGYSVRK